MHVIFCEGVYPPFIYMQVGYVMKKIKIVKENRTFEAYVTMLMVDAGEIIGLGISGNVTSCRAVHASLYDVGSNIVVYDDEKGTNNYYHSSHSYRRIEVLNGKVCHAFFLPRSAMQEDYEESLQKAEQENEEAPERIIIAPSHKIDYEVGMFLANTFGLPRTRDWVEKYHSLLPLEKWEEINVITTELIDDEWKSMRAIRIKSMQEKDVLNYIELAIRNGLLNPNSSIGSKAVFHEDMTTEEYLRKNAETLATHIDKYMKPKYDGTHFIRPIGETKRVSLPAQARLVMGALTVLKEQNSAFMVGDLGTGKTQMALTTAYSIMKQREQSGAKDGIRVLIVAPSIIVPKWATSEIPTILGSDVAKVTVLNSSEDAIRYVQKVKKGHKPKKGTIEFVLVSTDRMKLGANKYVLGARWNNHKHTWDCPDCGQPLISPGATEEEPDLLASWSDGVDKPKYPPSYHELNRAMKGEGLLPNGLPNGFVQKWSNKIRRFVCHECAITKDDETTKKIVQKNHSLVRPALRSRGEDRVRPRWMIAQIFQRQLPNHFHLGIFDEIQMFKSNNSGRGLSFHKLLKTTRKNLFLTATLTNGEASSIQATLWRSDPKSLLEEGFDHSTTEVAWAKKYGVLEQVTYRKDEGIVGVTTNRRQERTILKTKPGISPRLTANHLLHKSVFLDLSELGLPLVKKEEIPIILPLKDEHHEEYEEFHSSLYEMAKMAQEKMGSGAWAKFNPATLNYADQPHLGQSIKFVSREGDFLGQIDAPAFDEDFLTAKEEKLVEIVQENLDDERGCIIYNHYTGKYQQNERLKKVLELHGIEAEILDTKVSSTKRFEWLEKQKKKGTKVLIMNMSLVQVGLDLLEWPSIIYYQLNDDINVLRQAGGRNWRIGQNRNAKIYYLINQDTQQMVQFERLMTRRIEALLVEGRINRSDPLVKFAQENESKLARDLSYSLEASELEEKWKTTAEKDIDQDIEMVDENELKDRIAKAFSLLTNETKRLCGVPLGVEKAQEEKSNVIELPRREKLVDEAKQLDLFDLPEFLSVEVIPLKKKETKEKQTIQQFVFNL